MIVWVVTIFDGLEQLVFESRVDAYKWCWEYLKAKRAKDEAEGRDGFWWTARMKDLDDDFFATQDGDFGVEDMLIGKHCQLFKKGEF